MHHLTAGAASRRCFSAGIPRRHYLILFTPAKLPTSEPIVDHTFDTVLIERSLFTKCRMEGKKLYNGFAAAYVLVLEVHVHWQRGRASSRVW